MIRLNNVGLKYDRGPEVLTDVNFHLRPGSFHFLHGESGAGKTSLLRLMFMSLHPTRGQLYMFNDDVSRVSAQKRAQLRRRIGIVFQDFRLLDHLTVWENVALPLEQTTDLPSKEVHARSMEALKQQTGLNLLPTLARLARWQRCPDGVLAL